MNYAEIKDGTFNASATTAPSGAPMALLTITEAAGILKLSRSMIYELMKAGEIRYVQIGKKRRLRPADLIAFVDEHIRNRDAVIVGKHRPLRGAVQTSLYLASGVCRYE